MLYGWESNVEVVRVGHANSLSLVKVEIMEAEGPWSSSMSSWRLPTNFSNQ
jgi:hypothetical protein